MHVQYCATKLDMVAAENQGGRSLASLSRERAEFSVVVHRLLTSNLRRKGASYLLCKKQLIPTLHFKNRDKRLLLQHLTPATLLSKSLYQYTTRHRGPAQRPTPTTPTTTTTTIHTHTLMSRYSCIKTPPPPALTQPPARTRHNSHTPRRRPRRGPQSPAATPSKPQHPSLPAQKRAAFALQPAPPP
jgi:hypothetical protein